MLKSYVMPSMENTMWNLEFELIGGYIFYVIYELVSQRIGLEDKKGAYFKKRQVYGESVES
jgi:hypothetical protein